MAEFDNMTPEDEKTSRDKVYDFLMDKYETGDEFTRDELKNISGYNNTTFKAYFSKIIKEFCIKIDRDHYQVSNSFLKYTLKKKFNAFYSQKRIVSEEYAHSLAAGVIIFDLFMPLTNETELKAALDALFYKDSLMKRIKMIKKDDLQQFIPILENETFNFYYERVSKEISKYFGGYSIGLYNGRYLADNLKSFSEVAQNHQRSIPYLIDETTAIVRFIFPVEWHPAEEYNENQILPNIENEANLIRFLFENFFVKTILELVNGQEEIWLLESGLRYRLHRFKVEED